MAVFSVPASTASFEEPAEAGDPQIESTPSVIAANADVCGPSPHVLLVGEVVDDDTGAREQLRLEERVREEMPNPHIERARPHP